MIKKQTRQCCKGSMLILFLLSTTVTLAQVRVNLSGYQKKNGAKVTSAGDQLEVSWPANKPERAKLILNLDQNSPLFTSIQLTQKGEYKEIAAAMDPAFILTIGKRDLISQNGWNIFFDKTDKRPHQSYAVGLNKRAAAVRTEGSRTIIRIAEMQAASFKGTLEITLYNGSPLLNIAAVMATEVDSTAILYDAGLVSKNPIAFM